MKMLLQQGRIAIVMAILFYSGAVMAQRPVLTDEDTVREEVSREMDAVFASDDFLKKKSKKFADVTGMLVVDIGVIQNGKVSTFFKVDSDFVNMDFLSFVSDYILKHKFNFKLPKKQRYKIRYTASFK